MGGAAQNQKNMSAGGQFHCAEFQLNQTRLLYQFKIRKSVSEPMFAVIKEGSKALETIREGDVIPMRFYSVDRSVPVCYMDTKIKYISKNGSSGFKGHYMIALDVEGECEDMSA